MHIFPDTYSVYSCLTLQHVVAQWSRENGVSTWAGLGVGIRLAVWSGFWSADDDFEFIHSFIHTQPWEAPTVRTTLGPKAIANQQSVRVRHTRRENECAAPGYWKR